MHRQMSSGLGSRTGGGESMAVSKVKPSAFELQAVSSPVFGGGVPQGRVLGGDFAGEQFVPLLRVC